MPDDFNYPGVPTASDMEETLLSEPDALLGYREAFRVDEQANNRDGDSIEYPGVGEDYETDFVEIAKGDPHPNAALDWVGARSDWTNYGFKFAIHDDDIQDSKVNIEMANRKAQVDSKLWNLDAMAGQTLANAVTAANTIGTDSDPIDYSAVVDAETKLNQAGYNASSYMFLFSPVAWGEMAKSTEFTSDTEIFARELRGSGIQSGEILGYPIQRVNTGPLASDGDNSGEAYMVARDAFGWESPRRPFGIESWRDEDERQTWYALDGRIDWVSVDEEAIVQIDGGNSSI